jgi:hypothetical protein
MRTELRNGVDELYAAFDELRESRHAIQALDRYQQSLDVQRRALNELATAVAAVLDKASWLDISHVLYFNWFSFEQEYPALVSGVDDSVKVKRQELLSVIRSRVNQLSTAAGDFDHSLKSEANALRGEVEELMRRRADIERRTSVTRDRRDTALREIEARRSKVQSEIDDVNLQTQGLNEQMAAASADSRRMRQEIEGFVKDRRRSYNLCPQGRSYNDCTHFDLRAKWDQNSRLLPYARNRSSQIDDNNRIIHSLLSDQARLNRQREELWARLREFEKESRTVQARYRTEMEPIEQDLRRLVADGWRSRALVHSKENEADQRRVEKIVAALAKAFP